MALQHIQCHVANDETVILVLATGCDGFFGSTGSLSHFIYMLFIHLYVWFLCEK